MAPERWRQIEEVFQIAAEMHPNLRSAYLQKACGPDVELRAEVESLLGHDQPSTHIEEMIQGAAVQVVKDYSVKVAGQRIGSYEIVEALGKGGMGAVYLAVRADDVYRKQVAIKIVKRGMDTEFVLSRFRHERQILAGLEHPNIARLLDGGSTEEGLPYFVMEYVPGEPITRYCSSKRLPTRERLQVFRQVCSAVQYAHQNLVVHRDLKPGNILITAEGTPKLLDFGIAKVLNTDNVSTTAMTLTQTGLRLMTPDYASPEQIKGEAVTTASDVYSLGVILFELLTGQRPYQIRNHSPAAVLQAVCETATERPSTVVSRIGATKLRRQLAGDLDNIVLMAMRKEPERRYQSVEQFSEDLRRHLEGLPVLARKDTLRYRLAKFLHRNKLSVAAAALVTISLVGGIIATAYQAQIASRRFRQVRHLANAFLFEFHDSVADLPGSTKARELIVKKGLEYLDGLAAEAGRDATLHLELADAYRKVGDVQGDPLGSNLGDSAGARKSYQRAVEILEALQTRFPDDQRVHQALVTSYAKLASVMRVLGDNNTALETYTRAETLGERLQSSTPSRRTLMDLATIHDYKARTLTQMSRVQESLDSIRKALNINRIVLSGNPNDVEMQSNVATNHATLGINLARLERLPEAVSEFRKSVEMREKLVAGNPNNARLLRQLIIAYSHLGDALGSPTRSSLKDYDGASVILNKMLAIAEDLSRQDPEDRRIRMDVMFSLLRVANVTSVKDRPNALQHFRRALQIGEDLAKGDPNNATLRLNIAFVQDRIGDIELRAGNLVPALAHLREAVQMCERLIERDTRNQDLRLQLIESAGKYAVAQARVGNRNEAIQYPERLQKLATDLLAPGDQDRRRLAQLPLARQRAGEVFEQLAGHAATPEARRRDLQTAQEWYHRSWAAWEDLKRGGKLSELYVEEPARVASRLAGVSRQL
jgi:serine/threonine protein kinase